MSKEAKKLRKGQADRACESTVVWASLDWITPTEARARCRVEKASPKPWAQVGAQARGDGDTKIVLHLVLSSAHAIIKGKDFCNTLPNPLKATTIPITPGC